MPQVVRIAPGRRAVAGREGAALVTRLHGAANAHGGGPLGPSEIELWGPASVMGQVVAFERELAHLNQGGALPLRQRGGHVRCGADSASIVMATAAKLDASNQPRR